jgi:hypothetical protein
MVHAPNNKKGCAMLTDMIVHRSMVEPRRPDLHRHATFSCSWHAIMRYVGIDW